MTDMNRLMRIAVAVRDFMPPVWRAWHAEDGRVPSVLSAGTCGRTSLLLRKILRAQGYAATWQTGVAHEGCGFHDGKGWHGHSWVVCEGLIVDITADQFGAPPVIVAPAPDPRYRAGMADPALPERKRRRKRSAETAFVLWRQTAEATTRFR